MKLIELYIVSVRHPFVWKIPMRYMSAAIRFFTRSYYNHTALLEEYEDGSRKIVEMNANGINRHDYDEWAQDYLIEVHRPMFDVEHGKAQTIIDLCVELKLKYDYRGTLWYQMVWSIGKAINRWFGTNIKWMGYTSAGKAAQRFYCSEFVGWVFNKLNSVLFAEWWRLAPDEIKEQAKDIFETDFEGEASKYY